MSINQVSLSGNLTSDPELRSTSRGLPVLAFRIAVDETWKNSHTGQWETYPNFFDCTLFGKRGENFFKILSQGDKVSIAGKLRHSQWERDGIKHNKIDVVVNRIEFMHPHDTRNSKSEALPSSQFADDEIWTQE